MSKRQKVHPSLCVVCLRATIYPDAATQHPYGAAWEHRCYQCGSDQEKDAWFAHLRHMPQDTLITLQCPFVQWERCTQLHTFPLGDLLTHTPARAQFRCPQCDTWGTGYDLILSNKEALKHIVDGFVASSQSGSEDE